MKCLGSSRVRPANGGKAVTMLVGPTRPRPNAARPSAAVVPTPPQAPMNHKPTRRSFCSTPFGITDFLHGVDGKAAPGLGREIGLFSHLGRQRSSILQ